MGVYIYFYTIFPDYSSICYFHLYLFEPPNAIHKAFCLISREFWNAFSNFLILNRYEHSDISLHCVTAHLYY